MKPGSQQKAPHDWVAHQLHGRVPPLPDPASERRDDPERRRRVWWSVFYGSFNPRRRSSARRLDDSRFHALDWHAAHLLVVAIAILLLSVIDAFVTLILLSGGAEEVNPVMAAVVYKSASVFTALKMAMTGVSVVFMVFMARYRFLRVVRVELVLYAILAAYSGLICYEFWMLKALSVPLNV